MPRIRELAKTPGQLEITLTEDGASLLKEGDEKLSELLRNAKEAGRQYVMDATFPEATNEETAEELKTILIQAYQSPLYKNDEPFYGDILLRGYTEGEPFRPKPLI